MPRILLTDRFVAGARAKDDTRVDFFDQKTPGLCLRVSPGGNKSWAVLFTSPKDGKRARVTLGTYPAITLSSARGRALEASNGLVERLDPRDLFASQQATGLTVAGLKAIWFENHVSTLRSAQHIKWRVERNVIPVIGNIRLADLHRREINRVIDPIVKRGKPVEVNRVFQDMRNMFRWAVARGDLDRSPTDGMEKPSAEFPRARVLSDDEIRTLWNGLPGAISKSPTAQRVIRLCLITGQRVGEIAGMRRDELDLKRTQWSLPGSRTKNRTAHVVPLSEMAVGVIRDALDAAGKDSEFLFPAGVGPIGAKVVGKTVDRALEPTRENPKGRLSMDKWTVHDLRRTCLTGLAQLGIEPIAIGKIANHLTITKASVTFAVYVRYDYMKEKRRALDLWADRLAAVIEGGSADVIAIRDRKGAPL